MPETPTTPGPSGDEPERVRAAQPQGTERTRARPGSFRCGRRSMSEAAS